MRGNEQEILSPASLSDLKAFCVVWSGTVAFCTSSKYVYVSLMFFYRMVSLMPGVEEQPCLESSNEESDVGDGQVPLFQLTEWETEDYTRPPFTSVTVVEQLHEWFRFSGSNDFDLDSHHYREDVVS